MNAATPSSACLELVKRFEGFRPEPLALGADRWLIGYGHVRVGVPPRAIGETEAEFLLKEDLEEIAQVLRTAGVTQNQFDALAAFGFSIGRGALEESDVLSLVRAGAMMRAASAMERWTASGAGAGPDDLLIRRRAAEKALFLTDDSFSPAPSALLRPHRADEPSEAEPAASPATGHRASGDRTDTLGLAALGVLGLLLIAMGVTGADDDHGMAYFVFAGPGLVGVAMSVYYLLKKTVEAA